MFNENNPIIIRNTHFVYRTNFSGDPSRDNFGSDARRGNIAIPDVNMALELKAAGFNVKKTENRNGYENFVEEYFVPVNVNFDSKWPPKIMLVTGDDVQPLNEDTIVLLDNSKIRKDGVKVVLNPYQNRTTGKMSLYVQTMYAERIDNPDPFAAEYQKGEEVPF